MTSTVRLSVVTHGPINTVSASCPQGCCRLDPIPTDWIKVGRSWSPRPGIENTEEDEETRLIVRLTRFGGTPLLRAPLAGVIALDAASGQSPAGLRPTVPRQQSQTFNCLGTSVLFTVPSGVHQITIEARGSRGGTPTSGQGGSNGTGGFGAGVQAVGIPVTPGQQRGVLVGCAGGNQFSCGFGSGGERSVAA